MREYIRPNRGVSQSKSFVDLATSDISEAKGDHRPQPTYPPSRPVPALVSACVGRGLVYLLRANGERTKIDIIHKNEETSKKEEQDYDDIDDELSPLEAGSSWGNPIPMRLSRGMTPGTAIGFSSLSKREKNLLFGDYRDDPRDSSHYWEHLASRQE